MIYENVSNIFDTSEIKTKQTMVLKIWLSQKDVFKQQQQENFLLRNFIHL